MKSLDFTAMENVQGGVSGAIALTLPITGLMNLLGTGSGLGLSLGLGLAFSLPNLGLGTATISL